MAENPFSIAVKAGLSKQLTAKEYLMEVEGKTEEEANAILESIKIAENP